MYTNGLLDRLDSKEDFNDIEGFKSTLLNHFSSNDEVALEEVLLRLDEEDYTNKIAGNGGLSEGEEEEDDIATGHVNMKF